MMAIAGKQGAPWARVRRLLWAAPLALMLAGAGGDSVPQVVLATPGSSSAGSADINRFTLRFSEAMVPLGDPRAAAPAAHDCPVPGAGRWTDQRTWVIGFDRPLPGGTTCRVTLADGLRSLRGVSISGTGSFVIDTGGPSARAVLTGGDWGGVEEDQIFLVATTVAADRASVGTHGYCAVDGIGEKIALDVQPRETAEKILSGLGEADWRRGDFLANAGVGGRLPSPGADRDTLFDRIVAVKCRRGLPPGRDMALVWDARIAQAGAPTRTAGRDQRFDYSVRSAFTARVQCGRVNPAAGCNPVQDISLVFSAPVARTAALSAQIKLAGGKTLAADDDGEPGPWLTRVRFAAPLPENSAASMVLPADLADQSGRWLSGGENWPLAVRIDTAPPLVKFAAPFGILEAGEGGVLPVTVRAVEPALAGSKRRLTGQAARAEDDDRAILDWLRRVKDAGDSDLRKESDGRGGQHTVNYTGATSVSAADGPARTAAKPLAIALPGKGKDFEVVGIPLKAKGLHIVEFASPALGRALLVRPAVRHVATAALVTNMAVHIKWGRENTLVWVTALDSGKPVSGAAIRISDGCSGRLLGTGRSDAEGRLLFTGALPQPATYSYCPDGETSEEGGDSSEGRLLLVTARAGDDMSFTLTDWGQGIRPYDFDLPYGWSARGPVLHTIFDRTLVKAGESVGMKHVLRRPVGAGFALAPAMNGRLRLSHRGSGAEFELPFAIDASGAGDSRWDVPQAAPQGDYDLSFVTRAADGAEEVIWTEQSVRVDEYRLPTMKAEITGPKAPPVRPAQVPLALFAGYLSGGAAAGLPVTLRTAFELVWASPAGYDGWSFGGRPVTVGTQPLDDAGEEPQAPLPLARSTDLALGGDGTARTVVAVDQPVTEAVMMLAEMDYPDANGFRTLANGGRASPVRLTPGAPRGPVRQVVDAGAAYIVGDILADASARADAFGSDSALRLPFWAAVKTGTSKAMRDNWCIGWSDRFTVAVWVGNLEGDSMIAVSGTSGAAPVWRDIMLALHAGAPGRAPALPSGVTAQAITLPGTHEPPRRELFLAGTAQGQLAAVPARARRPRITSPVNGSVYAIDPDIPPDRQRLAVRVSGAVTGYHLVYEG